MTTDDPLVLPLANYLGDGFNSQDKTTSYDLRGGWDVVHLTRLERDTWAMAHGLPDQLKNGRRWTRTALRETLQPQWGADTVDQTIDNLISRDILAEITPGNASAVEFAREYRLVHLQMALGNTPEQPWLWRIGPAVPVIAVSGTVYHIWTWCHLYKSLWDSCRSLATMNAEDDILPGTTSECDPEAILTEVLETAHALLTHACAYFDVPYEWGTADPTIRRPRGDASSPRGRTPNDR